ncbi:MAG: hypothetical protein ACKVZH_21400 [Blastocatellia bacterium]
MKLKSVATILFLATAFLAFFNWPNIVSPVTPTVTAQTLPPVNYDIVYVRAPRYGDNTNTIWPEVTTPLIPDPGSDLMLLHPNGSEEILFDGGANGAVMDPQVSYDARSVVFAFFSNVNNNNSQRGGRDRGLSLEGADIYRIELASRKVTRLTNQEFTPNTGNGANFNCANSESNCPRVGVFNTGPAFLPDGKIVFTSTRDNYLPNRVFNGSQRVMQLWVMDGDGKNQHPIGHLNLSAAMHPFVLKDGRIAFTSWENQGNRDTRVFSLWAIWPDGTEFEPFSGFGDTHFSHHFMTQISNGDIVVDRYYNLNTNGFGELYSFPVAGNGAAALFQPIPPDNAPGDSLPLARVGYTRLTPFTDGEDFPAPCKAGDSIYPVIPCAGGNNTRVGKFTHPSAALSNELLVVWTRGAANHNGIYVNDGLARPFYDGGIYRMRGNQVLNRPEDLALVKNDPNYSEQWPRAVVPYKQIYGVDAPVDLPRLKNDGALHAQLPEGTPLGLIGTSSMISRDTRAFRGDRFYPHENNGDRNWIQQGADAGVYTDNDVYAVRILALQAVTDRSYPNNARAFASTIDERVRILGEIPVRKEGVIDPQGNTDTSFLAKIPADVPFTFQTLDRNGLVLNAAQTWHQVRAGEVRVNCGGCHAHSKAPLDFYRTAAAGTNYQIRDLSATTPLLNVDGTNTPGVTTINARQTTLEYLRDIRPIFQAKCNSCHTSKNNRTPDGGLDLDADDRLVDGIYPATYALLARPRSGTNPTPRSITPDGSWWFPQITRYVRSSQARQSLLVWKIFGRRLDGRTNADRPTEGVAGNPATIPAGRDFTDCDLDYTGDVMPPAGSPALTWEERMKIARWVDLGAPIDLTQIFRNRNFSPYAGYLEDDLRPTLSLLPMPEQAAATRSLTRFVIGAYDLESGIDPTTLSLTLSRAVGNIAAGSNLAAGMTITDGGVLIINLPASLSLIAGDVTATLQLRDRAGHTTRVIRTYRLSAEPFLSVASVSAASYNATLLAPEAIIAAFGSNLANAITIGSTIPLPTALAGTTVTIRDSLGIERLSPLFFVSPTQINYQMPAGTANGQASVTVISGANVISQGAISIAAVAPGLFTANASGSGLAAATLLRIRADGSQSYEPIARFDSAAGRIVAVPISFGAATDQLALLLFGTGLRRNSGLAGVMTRIGGVEVQTLFAGAQGDFVGLDQMNLLLPRVLARRGEVDVVVTVDGRTANTVRVSFGN